ncbi:MAG: hypothetical protein R3E67_01930 [Pseudomonadales bacterium]
MPLNAEQHALGVSLSMLTRHLLGLGHVSGSRQFRRHISETHIKGAPVTVIHDALHLLDGHHSSCGITSTGEFFAALQNPHPVFAP